MQRGGLPKIRKAHRDLFSSNIVPEDLRHYEAALPPKSDPTAACDSCLEPEPDEPPDEEPESDPEPESEPESGFESVPDPDEPPFGCPLESEPDPPSWDPPSAPFAPWSWEPLEFCESPDVPDEESPDPASPEVESSCLELSEESRASAESS